MLCKNLRAYLDDELAVPAEMVMRIHLMVCPECRSNASAWACIKHEIQASNDGPELPCLRERLIADAVSASASVRSAAQDDSRPNRMPRAVYSTVLVSACLVLCLLARGVFKTHPTAKEQVTIARSTIHPSASKVEVPKKPAENKKPLPAHTNIRKTPAHHMWIARDVHRPIEKSLPQTASVPKPAVSPDVHVEIRVSGSSTEIVVQTGSNRQVVQREVQNEIVPVPPDPEAAKIVRPELQEVVSTNQSKTIPEM